MKSKSHYQLPIGQEMNSDANNQPKVLEFTGFRDRDWGVFCGVSKLTTCFYNQPLLIASELRPSNRLRTKRNVFMQ